ncbi:hypothetical protein [Brevibacillus sp. NRS-1366]|uniref:hypothetical protein n=1 Tax=Brevibacillus sp. NRS-1366 TaxID=3233899 RepID=UPI003D251800
MKTIARAFVYSVLLNMLYYLTLPLISGLLLTWLYVPDVVSSYDSVQYLQQEVAFGQVSDTSFIWWKSTPLTLVLGMVMSLAFMGAKWRRGQQRAYRR